MTETAKTKGNGNCELLFNRRRTRTGADGRLRRNGNRNCKSKMGRVSAFAKAMADK